MKKYLKLKPNDKRNTDLKLDLSYSLGGMNPWTYRNERRGYYLIITPVERDGIMEGFEAFSGSKVLLKEVNRQSSKAEQEATALMNGAMNGIALTTIEAEQELWRELYAARREAVANGAPERKITEMTDRLKIGESRIAILDVMQRNGLAFE